ncbi:IS110 family transposase [Chloroflexota bacterium]
MKNSAAEKRKQVPVGYLVVGVDPHKKKHEAVFMTQDFIIHSKMKFDNSREGFEKVLERVRAEMLKTGCRGVIFAIETGAHHWRNLAYFLDKKGIPLRLINQFTLKRRREGKDLNHRKNDYRDSEVAAQLLCTGEFNAARLSQGVYAELRAAYGSYRRLVKERTRTVNLVKSLLDGLFPEFTQVFKNPCCQTAASVLSTCVVPRAIAGMTESEFVDVIKSAEQGRIMKGKLRALHHVAMTSIGIEAGAQSVSSEIAFLVEKLHLIEQQLGQINEILTRLVHDTREGKYLLSIVGLSYVSVAGIIAELGSFSSYRNAKQLVKMAGSNPTESESGGKRHSHTPISKQGRPVLRHCAWTAVIPMMRFNTDFRGWAKKRRERPAGTNPLSGREVMVAAMNKLLRLAFALVKNQTFYRIPEPQPVEIAT